jgi:hypothetical protein
MDGDPFKWVEDLPDCDEEESSEIEFGLPEEEENDNNFNGGEDMQEIEVEGLTETTSERNGNGFKHSQDLEPLSSGEVSQPPRRSSRPRKGSSATPGTSKSSSATPGTSRTGTPVVKEEVISDDDKPLRRSRKRKANVDRN